MDTLHKHNYSIETAMCSLVPSSGPVLCRDEMEEWSASEANLFEEALEKYGKDFTDIRNDFVSKISLNFWRICLKISISL
jgi:metastasis-associated protein MTA